jgi:adenylate kinase family enzyme
MSTVRRIAIIGTSGAGKTTLGRELARRLDAVFVECDAIRHKANWVRASDDEIRAGVDAAIGGRDRWVIDGTFHRQLGDFITGRCELIVWLDLPLGLKLVRLLRRSFRRVRTREVLWNGNQESWREVFGGRESVIQWAIRAHFRDRREWGSRPYRDKVLRLRSLAEIERWVATLP